MDKCKINRRKMKLPKKRNIPKNNEALIQYAVAWNRQIDYVKYYCNKCGEEYTKLLL